jgi:hypothetical protein
VGSFNRNHWAVCAGIGGQFRPEYAYKDAKPNGQGTMTLPDGSKYVGEFKDANMNGQGTYTHPDGSKYVGEFKDNKMNGQGTYKWTDGRKYVGDFQGWQKERTGHNYSS